MKKFKYVVSMAQPVWFVRASWSFMRGHRVEFWTGLIPAYVRYLILTIKQA